MNRKRLPSNYGNTLFIVFNKLFLQRASCFLIAFQCGRVRDSGAKYQNFIKL